MPEITTQDLFQAFQADRNIGEVARHLVRQPYLSTLPEITQALGLSSDKVSAALELLCQNGLVCSDVPGTKSVTTYSIQANSRELTESAVNSWELQFVEDRARQWKLSAQEKLEWIDGLYEMIQNGRRSLREDL